MSEKREVLYIGVFRIAPSEERDAVAVAHKAFLDAGRALGEAAIPGSVIVKEFEPDPEIACQPENSGKYVMATDHAALRDLGLDFEIANRLVPVVSEASLHEEKT